jgi:acetolactate synthase-1/2/3 large subunit
MYTPQSLWTQAREGLNVTTVVINNGSYAILRAELLRTGAGDGPRAADLVDLSRPDLDFVALAHAVGVPASRVSTPGQLAAGLRNALAEPGPVLIEATMRPRT